MLMDQFDGLLTVNEGCSDVLQSKDARAPQKPGSITADDRAEEREPTGGHGVSAD